MLTENGGSVPSRPPALREQRLVQTREQRQRLDVDCNSCAMAQLCALGPCDAQPCERPNRAVHGVRTVRRGQSLYRAGDSFQSVYAVRAGSFKRVVMHRDGLEQLTGFDIAGDMLGIDGISTGTHACDAIALEDSSVCVMPFVLLQSLCREIKEIQHRVHQMLAAEIVRESSQMLLLGAMMAEERVAVFLVDLSERWQARGYSACSFTLKMTRREIGSYLGLKLETVSRMITKLQKDGLIAVNGKDIRILDPDTLRNITAADRQ
ncbi:Transcriptional activator protein Anr [Paraburkholderia kururiensis]|uniref:helix-turn-helix domain-containing protein n=1 Tax=Paraburkholderia kururiensis TaxID=984307 RepID=UPI0039A58907